MKRIGLLAVMSLFFLGCNIHPSKEARIQKLEREMENAIHHIDSLEHRVKTLEERNQQLHTKLLELE